MVFRKFFSIFLFLFIIIGDFASAQIISGDDFIHSLKNSGQLGIFDSATISVFHSICPSISLSSSGRKLETFCKVVTSSEVCKSVEKDDLLNCKKYGESTEFDIIDFFAGCTTGLFDSARELLAFIWDALKWIWNKATDPSETYQEASEYIESVKLYLITEYDKAYDKESSPFRKIKASKSVASAVANMLFKGIQEYLYKEYQEFGCLNFKARTETICKVAGEIIIPPMGALALLKYGAKGIKANSKLKKFVSGKKKSLAHAKRKNLGESSLSRNLSNKEVEALEKAHLIGKGKKGKDGSLSKIGNYTLAHLKQKSKVLKDAGFSKTEVRKLMEDGVVGVSANGFARLFKKKIQLEMTGNQSYDQFRKSLNENNINGDGVYISYVDSNGIRVPGKVTSLEKGEIGVQTLNGKTVKLKKNSLEKVRTSEASKDYFLKKADKKEVDGVLGENKNNLHKIFKKESLVPSLKRGEQISIPRSRGGRSNAKIINVHSDGKIDVTWAEGGKTKIKTVDSKQVRRAQLSPNKIISTPLNNSPEVKFSLTRNKAFDDFREAYNAGNISGDNRFISLPYGEARRPAKVVDLINGKLVTEVVLDDGRLIKITLKKTDKLLAQIRVSRTSKEYFNRAPQRQTTPITNYNFSSTKLNDYKSKSGSIVKVNLESPHLKKWMQKATKIIEDKTGIKPGHTLSLKERNKVYRVWLDDIVKKVEDKEPFKNYGNARNRIIGLSGGKADLGKILTDQAAVCRELSICLGRFCSLSMA